MTTKINKKTLTNVIIIDASGSMQSVLRDVKGGLKQTFFEIKEDMKKFKDEMNLRTVIVDFSDDFNVLVDTTNPEDLNDTIADSYSTRGSTALFDAIGRTFGMVKSKDKNVFVTIFTDGAENASREFSGQSIKTLIAAKKKLGWAITFVGSTEEAMSNTQSIGVSRGMSGTSGFSGAAGSSGNSGSSGTSGFLHEARSMYYNAVNTCTVDSLVGDDTLLTMAINKKESKKKDTK